MLEREIEVKRNRFFLFSFSFLTIILAGVIFFIWAYRAFGAVGFRISEIITLIIAVFISVKHSAKFNKIITFNENYLVISHKFFKKTIEDKRILVEDIKSIIFDEKANKISIELNGEEIYTLVDFGYLKDIGIEKFFLVRAELYRYYPQKALKLKNEFVEKYINENMIPEYIRDLNFSGRCKTIVILILEVIFGCVPLVSCILSFIWGGAYLISLFIGLLIEVLNRILLML